MNIVILDAKTLGDDINLSAVHELGSTTVYDNISQNDVEAAIIDANVIILNKLKLNESNLKNAKNLKLICVTATGYDNIDVDYCKSHNIAVCNVVGYSSDSVAQLTVAMALSLCTNLSEYTEFVNDGSYTKSGVANKLTPAFCEMRGKTWGIVGLGAIGRQVSNVASALGCKVIAYKRTPDDTIPCCDLYYLFKESDIISIHLPLSEETKGIISKELISTMKPKAVLINVARGAVTDEKALAEAVIKKKIGGIGVDVYSHEPFSSEHPFYQLLGNKRALLTPHMAWGAYESRQRCFEEVLKNINAFFNGEIRNRLDL